MPIFTAILPCQYRTRQQIDIDLLTQVRRMTNSRFGSQRVWNRPLKYGNENRARLENLHPDSIQSFRVSISVHDSATGVALEDLEDAHPLSVFAQPMLGGFPDNFVWSQCDGWAWNYVAIRVEIAADESIARALVNEFSHLLKAAIQFTYGTNHFMFYGNEVYPTLGGVFHSDTNDGTWRYHQSKEHTFPADLSSFDEESFIPLIDKLADCWAGNTWPIHRYLKAFPFQMKFEVDCLLDLIFSLESIFPEVSSNFIRSYAGFLEEDLAAAKQVVSILVKAFDRRNKIAHAGKSFNPSDTLQVDGADITYQQLILRVKEIVSRLIVHGLENASANMGKPSLNNETFTQMIFKWKNNQKE